MNQNDDWCDLRSDKSCLKTASRSSQQLQSEIKAATAATLWKERATDPRTPPALRTRASTAPSTAATASTLLQVFNDGVRFLELQNLNSDFRRPLVLLGSDDFRLSDICRPESGNALRQPQGEG